MMLSSRLSRCLLVAMLFAQPAAVYAQSSLSAARDLYARAEYEQALLMLDSLSEEGSSTAQVAVVRALCLFALNKSGAAEHTIEAMVLDNPLFKPASEDLPPRVRTAITSVRRRVLPTAVQKMYADAKSAYDRKDYVNARDGFKRMMEALNDEALSPLEAQPGLLDLKTLATGFLDLSAAAIPPPPPPAPAPVAVAIVAKANPLKLYTTEDGDVVAPVVIRQQVPGFRGPLTRERAGVIEVVINEAGLVESAMMRVGIDPVFDRQAVDAAKGWRYQPATVSGTPVKFVKRIQVNLVPQKE